MAELKGVIGYHPVSKEKARELITPYSSRNGFYLLRPSTDKQGAVLCTICVTHDSKVLNYRVSLDRQRQTYYVNQAVQFRSVPDLITHYTQHALNEQTGTKLLHPVGGHSPAENGSDDCYVVMEKPVSEQQEVAPPPKQTRGPPRFKNRPLPDAPGPTTSQQAPIPNFTSKTQNHALSPTHQQNHVPKSQSHTPPDQDIPGLHRNLIKPLLKTAMQPYMGHSGYYLLRPSSTDAQLTLTVSHGGKTLNFKINQAGGQYFITQKNKFATVRDLIVHYHNSPIRSKQRMDQKILLVRPISVDPALEARAIEMVQQQQQAKQEAGTGAPSTPGPLPSPWQEFYNDQYKRLFYYNPETQQSTWERPSVPPPQQPNPHTLTRTAQQTKRIQARPLPSIPGEPEPANVGPAPHMLKADVGPAPHILKKRQTMPSTQTRPSVSKKGAPLPAIPQKSGGPNIVNGVVPSQGVGGRHVDMSERPPAPIPVQEDCPPQPRPSIPSNPSAAPPLPPTNKVHRHGSMDRGTRARPPIPVPEEERPVPSPVVRTGSRRELPALPHKETPPLPDKQDQPPPQPSSRPSPQQQGNPPQPGGGAQKKYRKKIIEYEDVPVFKPKKTAAPPLPKKEEEIPSVQPSRGPAPPLPEKDEVPPPRVQPQRGNVPPLPEKEDQPPYRGRVPPPPLPQKENKAPSLLEQTASQDLPPLPKKEDFTQIFPSTGPQVVAPVPPPLPPTGGSPSPPPPPGIPPPPSPMTSKSRENRSQSEAAISIDSGSRPFTANDLLAGAQRLKKVEVTPELRRNTVPEVGGGLDGALNRAIADKFRNTWQSDSEEEFEDVDDGEWDDY